MNFPRQLVLAIAAACVFLLALVAALVTLMQVGSADGSESAMTFVDRMAAITMVFLLACVVAGLALREFHWV